ncbi:MAG: isocitrate dehydrogenase kinase/phosphatase AceK regulatory subunit, partial [Acidimicrobiia bacterium]
MRVWRLSMTSTTMSPMTTSPALTDSRLANLGARAIRDAFSDFSNRFRIITRRARIRFEDRDWHGMARDARERLDLYSQAAGQVAGEIRRLWGDRTDDKLVWAAMKAVYSGLIQDRDDWELAETFFNSVTRRIFTTVGVDPRIEFVDTDFDTPPTEGGAGFYRIYDRKATIADLVEEVLEDLAPAGHWRSRQEDAQAISVVI